MNMESGRYVFTWCFVSKPSKNEPAMMEKMLKMVPKENDKTLKKSPLSKSPFNNRKDHMAIEPINKDRKILLELNEHHLHLLSLEFF
jgi:hypothetical protein